ncbi:hypothetical protein M569_11403 [Genlisea aurea]|uniref:BTB domain-containing protein n=1 Tax=Genlisea aurea TaxID=192259 RepID=S8DU60_9LAMI|nr:hypothetical protein M569_11403 [Genlisea aurea]
MAVSSSVSECRAVNGLHDFTIVRYSLAKLFGVGYAVKSETFKVGDRSWSIVFYPLGRSDSGSASIYLNLVDGSPDVTFNFEMSILEQTVGKGNFVRCENYRSVLRPSSKYWGWIDFIKVSELESSNYLKDDCIRIRCTITILFATMVRESHSQGEPIDHVPSSSSISKDLERLLEFGSGCDVTLVVDVHKFNAHKFILAARSTVFDAMFFGPSSDPNLKCATIPDMDPNILKAMLDFVYCDELYGEISNSVYRSLFDAADRYGFSRLKAYCQAKLCEDIRAQTVASVMVIAKLTNNSKLKSTCLDYVVSLENVEEVMKTDGFRDIVDNHSELLSELTEAIVLSKRRPR